MRDSAHTALRNRSSRLRRRSRQGQPLALDPLESRMLLSVSVASNQRSATYIDVDGDHVTIQVTSGLLSPANFVTIAKGQGDQLQVINLSGGGFDRTNLTITVAKVPGGDGLANIGYINSTGHDLGTVSIPGDLGRIDAGDGILVPVANAPSIKSLTVRSFGHLGLDTQPAGTLNLQCNLNGPLGSLTVGSDYGDGVLTVNGSVGPVSIKGSFVNGYLGVVGDVGAIKIGGDVVGGMLANTGLITSSGKIASVSIGGSIIGGSSDSAGEIFALISIGAVTVGQDIMGGEGLASGAIETAGNIAAVTVGGSVIGGAGGASGTIRSTAGNVPSIKIAGDLQGGTGDTSGAVVLDNVNNSSTAGVITSLTIGGSIVGRGVSDGSANFAGAVFTGGSIGTLSIGRNITGGDGPFCGSILAGNQNVPSTGTIGSLKIGGSIIGGAFTASGIIFTRNSIGPVTLGGSIIGGTISGADSVIGSGLIHSLHSIKSLTVGGSIRAGVNNSSAQLLLSGTVVAGDDIGAVVVKGGIVGTLGAAGFTPAQIIARGQLTQGATTDIAIKSITVTGNVYHANIFAGYTADPNTGLLAAVNGDAQIGAVSVAGDWIGSNIVAGAQNSDSGNTIFGDGNDSSIGAGNGNIVASIASITITGQVFGTSAVVDNADHFGWVAHQIGTVKVGGVSLVNFNHLALGPNFDFNIQLI